MKRIEFSCRPRPPFRLDLTVWALRRRARNEIDRWDAACYRRVLSHNGHPFEVQVTQVGTSTRPRLKVILVGPRIDEVHRRTARRALNHLLGLGIDLTDFYALARRDPHLGPLVARFMGVRPPRFPSVFEALINAVACQQLSLDVGIHLLNGLTRAYGRPVRGHDDAGPRTFPDAAALTRATPAQLRSLNFSRQKARAVRMLVEAVATGELDAGALPRLSDVRALQRLRMLRGIGRWSAEYVLLRGLGRTHIFPGDDVGARRGLAAWLRLDASLDYEQTARVLEAWRPYAGLVYFHLLLARLEREGWLADRTD